MKATKMGVDLSNLNVLVVDDEVSITRLVKMTLADLDVSQVYIAKNGMEALKLLGELDDIDVVICDWNMPRMSGLELLLQVRTVDHDMPFIMLTGRADVNSVKEAKDLGVSDYLIKPFRSDVLEKKLTRLARLQSSAARGRGSRHWGGPPTWPDG